MYSKEEIIEAINIIVGDDGSKANQVIEVLQCLTAMRPETPVRIICKNELPRKKHSQEGS